MDSNRKRSDAGPPTDADCFEELLTAVRTVEAAAKRPSTPELPTQPKSICLLQHGGRELTQRTSKISLKKRRQSTVAAGMGIPYIPVVPSTDTRSIPSTDAGPSSFLVPVSSDNRIFTVAAGPSTTGPSAATRSDAGPSTDAGPSSVLVRVPVSSDIRTSFAVAAGPSAATRRASNATEATIENVQEFKDVANLHCTDTSFADDRSKKNLNPSIQMDKELHSSKRVRHSIPKNDNIKNYLKSEEPRKIPGKPEVRSNSEAQDSLKDTNNVMNYGVKQRRTIYDPLGKSSVKTLLANSLVEQQKPEGKSDVIVSEVGENSKTLLAASLESRTVTINNPSIQIDKELHSSKRVRHSIPKDDNIKNYLKSEEPREITGKREVRSIELSHENGLDDSEIKDPPEKYFPAYLNLSTNYRLSLKEIQLLSLGYNFEPTLEVPVFYEFIPLIEEFLKILPKDQICQARKSLSEEYKKQLLKLMEKMEVNEPNNDTLNRDMKELINQLKRNDNIIILRADESAQFVILDRKDYDEKLQEMLHLNYEEYHGTDPTLRAQKILNEFRNNSMLPDDMKKYCTKPIYSSVPQLFTRIQLHILNKPLRPIISRHSFPTYNLEHGLAEYLRKNFPPNTYTIESPKEFLEILKTIQLEEHHKLVTLNILTHKIPTQVSIDLIQEELMQNVTNPEDISEKVEVIKALNFVVNENYCQTNKKIYHQTFGIPLGGQISTILLDVLLRSIESTIATRAMSPKLYMRFEDNIFIIWDNREGEFDTFWDELLPRNSAIKFTKHETEAYRKPTSTSPFIQYDSRHTKNLMCYKLFERAYTHSSNERNREELSVLYEHVKNMGYPNRWMRFIVHWVENFRDKILRSPKAQSEEEGYVLTIPNIRWLNEKLQTKLDECGVRHCKLSISETTLGKLLVEYVEPSGGVYLILLKRETDKKEKIYIGKTNRQLTQRIKEHKYQIRGEDNAIGLYCAVEENFEPLFDETVIICSPPTEIQLEWAEDILIYANIGRVCNKRIRNPADEWKHLLDYFKGRFPNQ